VVVKLSIWSYELDGTEFHAISPTEFGIHGNILLKWITLYKYSHKENCTWYIKYKILGPSGNIPHCWNKEFWE
jgi:hypothetical protein